MLADNYMQDYVYCSRYAHAQPYSEVYPLLEVFSFLPEGDVLVLPILEKTCVVLRLIGRLWEARVSSGRSARTARV